MITSRQLANTIQDALNALAADAPFTFAVYAEIGEYRAAIADETRKTLPKPVINGVMITLPSQIVPLQSVKSFTMSQLVTFYVPVKPNPTAEGTYIGIDEPFGIIKAWVENSAGLAGTMSDEEDGGEYSYVLTPQFPNVGAEDHSLGAWHIPVSVSLVWQFIEGGVVGNSVKITVGGQAAVLLEGGFSRTRIADTNPREGSEEMTTVIGQQGLTLRVLVPYIRGGVGQQLVTDALTGALDKTYAVTYSDGVAFTDSAPFAADMVTTGISFSFNPGTTCSVEATFVLADGEVYDNA